jgi:poly-gamma-glutamate synthesis protein (capsule biosynthesis protein)
MKKNLLILFLLISLLLFLLPACQRLQDSTPPFTAPTAAAPQASPLPDDNSPTQAAQGSGAGEALAQSPTATSPLIVPESIEPTPAEVFLPITASQTVDVWVAPGLPALLHSAESFAPNVRLAAQPPADDTSLTVMLNAGSDQVVSRWVYALVTPFSGSSKPGVRTITYVELLQHWQGQGSGPFAGQPLWMTQETLEMLTLILGGPRPESVRIAPAESLLAETWAAQESLAGQPVLALIPFEAVEPRWSVVALDGQSPLHNDFDLAAYPLVVPVSLYGNPTIVARILAADTPENLDPLVVRSNRESNRLTVVAMTGVTALVRSTAATMEIQGNTYPARDIGPILRAADITHISNEVPFAENCPEPDPYYASLRFCSQDEYIELLEDVSADVIELTGDHFHDWGPEAMLHTVDLYNQRQWPYYGGGINLADGQRPATFDHNGNRLAFLGCNGKGPFFARATETNPGSAPCDMPKMAAEVARLQAEGYLVIFTFQHHETYSYYFPPTEKDDFRMVADAGAVVVSGSQAHTPHEMEFYAGAYIHYGLGNLFFDQYLVSELTRQGLIDRHVFYDSRYLGLEIIPIYFVDFARARLMTDSETTSLLAALFAASVLAP